MRKLTRKQILARLFVSFFTLGSLLCTVNSAVAGGPSETYGKYYYNEDDFEFPFDNLRGIKKTGSDNIIKLTITGPDSPAPDIYSGYTDSDGDIKNNKLTITTNEGVTTKLSNVYGGYVATGIGSATQNIVNIASSTVNDSVVGGYVGYVGSATQNIVKIASSTVTGAVVGGYVYSSGSATENKVDIVASSTVNTVYGGGVEFSGNATQNIVNIASSTVNSYVYGGYVYSGSATQNIVDIASSTVKTVYGGYVNQSDSSAAQNKVHITDSKVNSYVYGGFVGSTSSSATLNEVDVASSTVNAVAGGWAVGASSATENKVDIASSTVANVFGGYSQNGNAESNTVEIRDNSKTTNVYGGYVNNGDVISNNVTIKDSEVNKTVLGGYVVGSGNANLNEVDISSSTVTDSVYGGKVGTDTTGNGNAVSNTITIKDSDVSVSTIYGGYTYNGDANSNTVEITNSKTATVWGGYIKSESATGNTNSNTLKLTNCEINAGNIVAAENNGTGDGVENTVEVSGGIIKIDLISGAQLRSGDAILNKVTISDLDSPATYTYIIGGTVTNGNAYSNAVTLDNLKELNCTLVAGGYLSSGEAASNTVTIKNSNIKGLLPDNYVVLGGGVTTGDAKQNEVTISGSTVNGNVYGGFTTSGYADENIIKINDGSTVTGDVSSGYVNGDGNATNNTVEISGGSTVSGSVYGGKVNGTGDTNDAKTGNKLIISGVGNKIGGSVENFESITFDATDVKKDETMLSLTTESPFTIGVKSIETNNADLSVGEKITLISSAVDNLYDGSITYKIDGKQAIDDGSGLRHYIDSATEDADKIVHVDELAYVKEDKNLNLCKTTGFITGLYNGFDAEDAKQILGQAEMTINSVPQDVNMVYGAYSEDEEVKAGGVTVNLETTELSDVNLIGSYNDAAPSLVDTANNTLNVNVSGVKVNSVDGFGNMNFKLASDENAMLEVKVSDGFVMNGMNFNSILPEDGLEGTKTIIKVNNINADGAKFTINNSENKVSIDEAMTTITSNGDNVIYGTYKYTTNGESIALTGKSIVGAVIIAPGETKTADDKTLKLTNSLAEKYTELYGAFNADGGAATNATVELSEAVSNENLTIYGGYSTDSGVDVTTGNTLKVSKNGNKIKNIQYFSKLDFSLDSDNSNNPTCCRLLLILLI